MLRTRATNFALSLQTAELFKVSTESAQRIIDVFTGLRSHQELVKKIDGVEFYNDSASVTPLSTIFALQTLGGSRNIVLIMGGAYTRYEHKALVEEIPKHVTSIILLPGTGSLGIRQDLEKLKDVRFFQAFTLEDAVIISKGESRKGDRVIFSPGFEAVGIHISRKERGEKFVKAVRSL
jgi:UDP-N-acetylmuramoylalanine--D-glutamate ligase